MYPESDLLPLSGLQHLAFCERQWGLIHLEQFWNENRLTARGRLLHERVDQVGGQSRKGVRIVRALWIHSLRLGLIGRADVVEFHRLSAGREEPVACARGSDSDRADVVAFHRLSATGDGPVACGRGSDAIPKRGRGIANPGPECGRGDANPSPKRERGVPPPRPGGPIAGAQGSDWAETDDRSECTSCALPGQAAPLRSRYGSPTQHCLPTHHCWQPFPVEYKHGRPKKGDCDRVQLCAQAMCLEEMLGISVPAGALFYGRTRRRIDVTFDQRLRSETERLAARMHELFRQGVTPRVAYAKKRCDACSLIDACLPKTTGAARRVESYLAGAIYIGDAQP